MISNYEDHSRSTQVRNTTRPDTIWPEEWPSLSKKQTGATCNWDVEETRLRETRGKTGLFDGSLTSRRHLKLEQCVVLSLPCIPFAVHSEGCLVKPKATPMTCSVRKLAT